MTKRYIVELEDSAFNGIECRGPFRYETKTTSGSWILTTAPSSEDARKAHEAIARSFGVKLWSWCTFNEKNKDLLAGSAVTCQNAPIPRKG